MGANYIKGRVADVTETPDGNLVLRYEDIENGGGIVEAEYDLVVLAVGVQPNRDAEQLFEVGELAARRVELRRRAGGGPQPGATSIPGVFVAGAASGAKDIADSILHGQFGRGPLSRRCATRSRYADNSGCNPQNHREKTGAQRPTAGHHSQRMRDAWRERRGSPLPSPADRHISAAYPVP